MSRGGRIFKFRYSQQHAVFVCFLDIDIKLCIIYTFPDVLVSMIGRRGEKNILATLNGEILIANINIKNSPSTFLADNLDPAQSKIFQDFSIE